MLHLFIRPSELRGLNKGDLLLDKNLIRIRGEVAKNGKNEHVTTPRPIVEYLMDQGFKEAKVNDYVFSKDGVFGPEPLAKNYLGMKFRECVDALQDLEEHYTLYSLKHTGVMRFYEKTKDIKALQAQCRHYSIEVTDRYLKSLGFEENTAFLEGFVDY